MTSQFSFQSLRRQASAGTEDADDKPVSQDNHELAIIKQLEHIQRVRIEIHEKAIGECNSHNEHLHKFLALLTATLKEIEENNMKKEKAMHEAKMLSDQVMAIIQRMLSFNSSFNQQM